MKNRFLATTPGRRPAAFVAANLLTGASALLLAFAHDAQAQTTTVSSIDPAKLAGSLVSSPTAAVVTNYHSWSNAVSLNNGLVEAIIVPADGRLQQFRFLGESNGVLWESPSLFGRTASGSRFYINFGGDKAWPSPQSDWNWPPPSGFDGNACTATFTNGLVTLATPVDASYGIRVTRIIGLVASQPVMVIRTIFERTAAPTRADKELGVWIDCQATVTPDSRCYAPVPSPSIFSDGYTTTGSSAYTPALPTAFTNANGLISFARDPLTNHKVGFDGGTLALVGPSLCLRMDAPRVPGATYPDGNSSTEVYTTGGRDSYFELELMGPMAKMPVGGKLEYVAAYSLFHRTESTTDAEAQKILKWKF